MEERLRRKGVDVDAAKSPTRDDEDADADEYAATSAFVTRGDVPRGEDACDRVAELVFRQDAEGWPAQKTEAWKFARASALTASDVARVLEGGDARGKVLRQKQRVRKEEESMRQKQIVRKQEESSMTPSTETKRDARRERRWRAPTSAAIRHGNEFEAEALAHYERTHGTTCLTFGLKIHDDHYWLGASPDGVHPSGRVVEIKCPYSRAVVPRARAPWSTTPRFKPRSRYSTSNFATSSNTNRPVEAKVAPAIPTARSTSWKPCPETANGSPARSTSFARSPSPSHHRDPRAHRAHHHH